MPCTLPPPGTGGIAIKKLIITIVTFCLLVGLTACTGDGQTVITTARDHDHHEHLIGLENIGFWFADKGFILTIIDWPPNRSERFPSYLTPQLMKLSDNEKTFVEEVFVFEFDSVEKAQDELGDNVDVGKMVYSKDAFILMYNGENQIIIDTLKEHFTEVHWK